MTADTQALDLLDDLLGRAKAAGAEAADAVVFDSIALAHARRLQQHRPTLLGNLPQQQV